MTSADKERDLAAEFSLRRHTLELGLFERPVFDAKRLRARQCHVIMKLGELERLIRPASVRQRMPDLALVECIRPSHHMNCVYKKLRGDSSFLLALAEAKQSDAWNDHDRRVRVAELRRIWGCPGLVILHVFGAI